MMNNQLLWFSKRERESWRRRRRKKYLWELLKDKESTNAKRFAKKKFRISINLKLIEKFGRDLSGIKSETFADLHLIIDPADNILGHERKSSKFIWKIVNLYRQAAAAKVMSQSLEKSRSNAEKCKQKLHNAKFSKKY